VVTDTGGGGVSLGERVRLALLSAWVSSKAWFVGVLCGFLTLALGSGAVDNRGFMDAIRQHWVLWLASSLVTMLTGSSARVVQHLAGQASGSVQQGAQAVITKLGNGGGVS
jgi:hypothetical protein